MATQLTFGVHPAEDVLEEYAFDRLEEQQTGPLEEHLLMCPACQESLASIDEYILLMKQALLERASLPPARPPRFTHAFRVAPAWTTVIGALAAAALVVFAVRWTEAPRIAVPVELVALRGGGAAMAKARAGDPLEIRLDVSDIASGAVGKTFRLEMVDAFGREVWSRRATSRSAKVIARVDRRLGAGIYWVRLYSDEGDLLREFGLQAR